jgi:uncharacterized membrane protein YphA (DoxX/SURF4 family)
MRHEFYDRPGWRRAAIPYARIALGAAFLSGIASRFGLWGANVGYGNFANFVKATAYELVHAAFTIPFLAWAATIFELFFGLALIIGIWPRWVSLGSAVLLALFGIAMAISGGIKDPLDYSVFSASACALLLAFQETKTTETKP